MQRTILWTMVLPLTHEHEGDTCLLAEDINSYTFSRRYGVGVPDVPCLARHIVRGELAPTPVWAYTFDEYSAALSNYTGISSMASMSFDTLQEYVARHNYRRPFKISRSTQTVYVLFPVGYEALPVSDVLAEDQRLHYSQMRSEKVYQNCRFVTYGALVGTPAGLKDTTIRNTVFWSCAFEGGTWQNAHFENCLFFACNFHNVQAKDCVFSGGAFAGSIEGGTWDNCRMTLAAESITAAHATLQRLSIAADYTGVSFFTLCCCSRLNVPASIELRQCTTASIKGHTCVVCKQVRFDCIRIARAGWLCLSCKAQKYNRTTSRNETYKGISDGLPAFSFELETAGTEAALEKALSVLAYGFIATRDGTVDVEYKSPRYLSAKSALPALRAIDDWAEEGINEQCGTHLHVNCPLREHISDIVFHRLLEHCRHHTRETVAFWGRTFNGFCEGDTTSGRYCAFSLCSHYPTLEWRLPRYRQFKQYLRVIQFCRRATKLISEQYALLPSDKVDADKLGQQVLNLYLLALKEEVNNQ